MGEISSVEKFLRFQSPTHVGQKTLKKKTWRNIVSVFWCNRFTSTKNPPSPPLLHPTYSPAIWNSTLLKVEFQSENTCTNPEVRPESDSVHVGVEDTLASENRWILWRVGHVQLLVSENPQPLANSLHELDSWRQLWIFSDYVLPLGRVKGVQMLKRIWECPDLIVPSQYT